MEKIEGTEQDKKRLLDCLKKINKYKSFKH